MRLERAVFEAGCFKSFRMNSTRVDRIDSNLLGGEFFGEDSIDVLRLSDTSAYGDGFAACLVDLSDNLVGASLLEE